MFPWLHSKYFKHIRWPSLAARWANNITMIILLQHNGCQLHAVSPLSSTSNKLAPHFLSIYEISVVNTVVLLMVMVWWHLEYPMVTMESGMMYDCPATIVCHGDILVERYGHLTICTHTQTVSVCSLITLSYRCHSPLQPSTVFVMSILYHVLLLDEDLYGL